jgi:hypothetical protein
VIGRTASRPRDRHYKARAPAFHQRSTWTSGIYRAAGVVQEPLRAWSRVGHEFSASPSPRPTDGEAGHWPRSRDQGSHPSAPAATASRRVRVTGACLRRGRARRRTGRGNNGAGFPTDRDDPLVLPDPAKIPRASRVRRLLPSAALCRAVHLTRYFSDSTAPTRTPWTAWGLLKDGTSAVARTHAGSPPPTGRQSVDAAIAICPLVAMSVPEGRQRERPLTASPLRSVPSDRAWRAPGSVTATVPRGARPSAWRSWQPAR